MIAPLIAVSSLALKYVVLPEAAYWAGIIQHHILQRSEANGDFSVNGRFVRLGAITFGNSQLRRTRYLFGYGDQLVSPIMDGNQVLGYYHITHEDDKCIRTFKYSRYQSCDTKEVVLKNKEFYLTAGIIVDSITKGFSAFVEKVHPQYLDNTWKGYLSYGYEDKSTTLRFVRYSGTRKNLTAEDEVLIVTVDHNYMVTEVVVVLKEVEVSHV